MGSNPGRNYSPEHTQALRQSFTVKPTFMDFKAKIAYLVGLCAELHAAGAVRPEHSEKFAMLRTGLDQANDLATAEIPPAAPDVAAYAALAATVEALGHQLEAVGVIVDHTGDQVQSLVDLANTAQA